MKKLLSLVLAVAFCAPAFAQRGPKIEQTIAWEGAKISLSYTALSYGEGKTVAMLLDKEGGKEMREMMNERSAGRPLATFTTSVPVMCGDATLAAGEHQVFFTVSDDLAWTINFKQGDKVTAINLKVEAGKHESKRLMMSLHAEEASTGVYLSFGKYTGMLNFTPSDKDTKKASGDK